MTELSGKFFANLHILILLYSLWGVWTRYDEHSIQMEGIQTEVEGLNNEITINKKKLGEIDEFKKKRDEFLVRIEGVKKNIENVQKQLPAETNDSEITSFFRKDLETLNIKNVEMTPGADEQTQYYIAKDYQIRAKGTFLQLLIFIERLASAERIYNVKTLRFFSSNESQKGRFRSISADIVVQAYRYNPNFKVTAGN